MPEVSMRENEELVACVYEEAMSALVQLEKKLAGS
jgi:hypothetical protein